MSIPESQLETWSNQGAVTKSSQTYTSVKAALSAYNWPSEMSYEVFLQGSYANTTNIYADSDVDIVVKFTNGHYHNLSSEERQKFKLVPVAHTYEDHRSHLIAALTKYYGSPQVDSTGNKALAVLASDNRLKADVLHSHVYKYYKNLTVQFEGIAFYSRNPKKQIINYPKQHRENGENKNATGRTKGRYKPSVRMFKNARKIIVSGDEKLRQKFPSYFIECLFYNVPDENFSILLQDTFINSVNYLSAVLKKDESNKFVTQSGRHWLFGNGAVQWPKESAIAFVQSLIHLWNKF